MLDYYARGSLSAATYDLVNIYCGEFIAGDIQFYSAIGGMQGGKVLELGCGTGRVTMGLAEAGYQVTGLDASAGMLELARSKLAMQTSKIQRRIQYEQGDLSDFNLNDRFDLVVVPYYAFNHLLTPFQRYRALGLVRQHMKTTAQAVLHTIPQVRLMKTLGEEALVKNDLRVAIPDSFGKQLCLVIRSLSHVAHWEDCFTDLEYEFSIHSKTEGVVLSRQERLRYAWVSDEEMISFCEAQGLSVLHQHRTFLEGVGGDENIWTLIRSPKYNLI